VRNVLELSCVIVGNVVCYSSVELVGWHSQQYSKSEDEK